MVFSDWPSVWGWNAVLNFNLLPKLLWRLSQKYDTNLVSLSEIILKGTPCCLNISYMYLFASASVDCPTLKGMKWALLVSQSMITHIALFPLGLLGRPTTKSMVILSHFHSGIGSGCSSPAVLWCSALTCWHTRQRTTNRAISLFIPCHQKCCLRSPWKSPRGGGE